MSTPSPRKAAHEIDAQFIERWSPRAFTGETLSEKELLTMIEAARWAPSASNSQPWRFVYARRDSGHWDTFLSLLNPGNQVWAKNAGALLLLVSKTTLRPPGGDKDVPARNHSFDTGAAWQNLALQAMKSGWAAHAMIGVDFEKAASVLGIPPGHKAEAAIAIGRVGDASTLPDALRAREVPSDRLPLSKIACEGRFDPETLA